MSPVPSLNLSRFGQKKNCRVNAIILAGGNSSRMGFDKTFINTREDLVNMYADRQI